MVLWKTFKARIIALFDAHPDLCESPLFTRLFNRTCTSQPNTSTAIQTQPRAPLQQRPSALTTNILNVMQHQPGPSNYHHNPYLTWHNIITSTIHLYLPHSPAIPLQLQQITTTSSSSFLYQYTWNIQDSFYIVDYNSLIYIIPYSFMYILQIISVLFVPQKVSHLSFFFSCLFPKIGKRLCSFSEFENLRDILWQRWPAHSFIHCMSTTTQGNKHRHWEYKYHMCWFNPTEFFRREFDAVSDLQRPIFNGNHWLSTLGYDTCASGLPGPGTTLANSTCIY